MGNACDLRPTNVLQIDPLAFLKKTKKNKKVHIYKALQCAEAPSTKVLKIFYPKVRNLTQSSTKNTPQKMKLYIC